MGAIEKKIHSLEIKFIALGRAISELHKELETVKRSAANPAPAIRRRKSQMREQEIADFYAKQRISTKH